MPMRNLREENLKDWIMSIMLSVILTFFSCLCHYAAATQTKIDFLKDIVYINNSPSLPMGIYLRIPMLWLNQDDYVVYSPPDDVINMALQRGWIEDSDVLFLKRVRGLPGDTYSVTPIEGFYVNGKYQGQVEVMDAKANPMPQHYGQHVVPLKSFLPGGEAVNSYDGRYTGPVPINRIKAKVIPIITDKLFP